MHAILIAGVALVGLPVLLHLIMKQRPKKLVFPALRFLRPKQKTNQRKMRLRHFLLLALRMLLILLFALALFQPKIGEKYKAPLIGEFTLFGGGSFLAVLGEQPVAAVLIVDTSPSMSYKVQGVSRFDEAKRRAHEFLDDLPAGSRVAILDPNEPIAQFADNIPDAHKKIDTLPAPAGYAKPISDALSTAYTALKDAEKDTDATEPLPRVVVVFGDRTTASWDTARIDGLVKERDGAAPANAAKVAHLFVDVGVEKPTNAAILNVSMTPQLLSGSAPAVLNVSVRADGADVPSAKLEAILDDGAKVETKELALAAGSAQNATFTFAALAPGYHTVVFKLRDDNLAFDNERSFTFAVAEKRKILTISDVPFDAVFWRLAHATRQEFDCTVVTPDEAKDFGGYEAVVLLNVAEPVKLQAALRTYVVAGGKLLIAPGLQSAAYANFDLMPAQLANIRYWTIDDPKRPGGVTWKIDDDAELRRHKLMEPFLDWKKRGNVDVIRNPRKAWRHYELTKLTEGAQVVVYYDDGEEDQSKRLPAIVEGIVGRGKVLLLSTRIDPQDDADPTQTWNDYWKTTNSSWPTVFPNLLIRYLAGSPDDAVYNLPTGPPVELTVPTQFDGKPAIWQFAGPGVSGNEANPKEAEAPKDGEKPIVTPVRLAKGQFQFGPPLSLNAGEFRLKAKDHPYEQRIGLAVDKSESNLDKVPAASIEALFGPNAIIADDKELKLRDIVATKFDQPIPLFPILLALVLVAFAAEGFLSKIFYKVRR